MDPILVPLICAVLAAIGAAVRAWLKTVLTPQRMTTILDMARAAIAGAEELGNVLDMDGASKYEYAEGALRDMARRVGVNLSDTELNAYIHALLYQQHENDKAFAENDELLSLYAQYADTKAPDEVDEVAV